jgi:hypothetical protein
MAYGNNACQCVGGRLTVNCPKCGANNLAENNRCTACGRHLRAAAALHAVPRRYRDAGVLTCWLRGLLISLAVTSAASAVLAANRALALLGLLRGWVDMILMTFPDRFLWLLAHLAFGFVLLPTIVVFCIWIYRVHANILALNILGLETTPAFAVGAYIIPFVNLWKPYRAMSEVWRASRNPMGWKQDRPGPLLAWWWVCWIASSVSASVFFVLFALVADVDDLMAISFVGVGVDFLYCSSAVLSLLLVTRLHRRQVRVADHALSGVFA